MKKNFITPESAYEHLKTIFSQVIFLKSNEQPNKIFFKILIDFQKITITLYLSTGTIQTQPKNIEIEKILEDLNNSEGGIGSKRETESKKNIWDFFKNVKDNILPIETIGSPLNTSSLLIKNEETPTDESHTETALKKLKTSSTNYKESINITTPPLGIKKEDPDLDQPIIYHFNKNNNKNNNKVVDLEFKNSKLNVPPIFNQSKKTTTNTINTTKRNARAYIAHSDNEKSNNFIKEMLIKLQIDMIIVPQNDNGEFTKSNTDTIIEAYQEIVQPNLNLLLEMGYLISHFGKQKTIIVEFSPIKQKTNQFNIDPTLIHYQSFNTNLIIDEILKITNNIN
ncbi:hypothetical protein ACTFIY_002647 [Dictyostelium cf. discoideum]